MIQAEEARRTILSRATALESVRLPLAYALDRVLRTAVTAEADAPPFDASAMDGYAARRADLGQPLRVVGEIQAGATPAAAFQPGECLRIFTGAPVPAGADCVVKQEDVTRQDNVIRVTHPDGPDFIRRRGENRRAGEIVLAAGTVLGPVELAALAAVGATRPEVARAPRCVHLVTGNELVPPDQTPVGAQIRDSNSALVAALLARHGAELTGHSRVGDDLAGARAAVENFPIHDLLFISGGASVGDHDFARPLLKALGYELHFEAVNQRPGRPLAFGSRGAQFAFALPGNPVSHWVTFQLFVAPLLQKLQTGVDPAPVRARGRLAPGSRLPASDGRRIFWPCRATLVGGETELTLLPLTSSGDGLSLVGANALLPVPANSLDPAQPVEFIPCL